MNQVIFGVTKEFMGDFVDNAMKDHEDSILVLAPLAGSVSIHAPSKKGKYKGFHRFKFEVWIPEDTIKGDSVLDDIGAVTLMRIPKNRINENFLEEE